MKKTHFLGPYRALMYCFLWINHPNWMIDGFAPSSSSSSVSFFVRNKHCHGTMNHDHHINYYHYDHSHRDRALWNQLGYAKTRTESSSTLLSAHDLSTFQSCLEQMSLPSTKQIEILNELQSKGFTSTSELYAFAIDFQKDPRMLSQILIDDFGFSVVQSHLVRGALLRLVQWFQELSNQDGSRQEKKTEDDDVDPIPFQQEDDNVLHIDQEVSLSFSSLPQQSQPLFKSVIVNAKAKQRHSNTNQEHNYGLPNDYKTSFPIVAQELDEFMTFMIQPSMGSMQESPIRKATANVYLRHAKLFLGWYSNVRSTTSRNDSSINNVSIHHIFPTKDATSSQPIIEFILWLRQTRDISHSYEANMLRGLTKLLKFRFCRDSKADPSYGEKSFADIPVVRELRKLHRDANRRQLKSPRSSEEDQKWLDWEEYLTVVNHLKEDVVQEMETYSSVMRSSSSTSTDSNKRSPSSKVNKTHRRRIATKYQAYLILAFFSCVPDRQRTFRELDVGRSFLKDEKSQSWIIKHGPDDYKTGKTYGDRPPLVLSRDLTPDIDDFLQNWRDSLEPTGPHFFIQPRTGNRLTQDSVYSMVARSCFKYTGKKTNPHIIRDMIVTHVRNTDASEKELEALALYMGHSISMQRNSYDRRTMEQKVAPAVELLRSVNGK